MSTILRTLAGLVLVAAALEATGMYARYSDQQLVDNSDLIAVATLVGRTTIQVGADAAEITVGVLTIENQLKGDVASVALVVLPAPGAPIASDAITYDEGQRGLWFLRRQPGSSGLYLADHPQRYEPLENIDQRITALKQMLGSR